MTFQPDPIEEVPQDLAQLLKLGRSLHVMGDLSAAADRYAEVLRLDPRHFTATHLLGVLRNQQGIFSEAEALFRQAFALNPRSPRVNLDLATALSSQGHHEDSFRHVLMGLRFAPEHPDLLFHGACALQAMLRPTEALDWWNRFLTLEPNALNALMNQGTVLLELQRPAEALASYDRALALKPDWPELLLNRATALVDLKRPEEALASLEAALKLKPDWPDLHMNLGSALHQLGHHREAIASYDLALMLNPGHVRAHSSKIGIMDFLPDLSPAEHQRERRRFWQLHAEDISKTTLPPERNRQVDRKLILGYVSADFKHHATASIFLPILQRHTREEFQVNCYSSVVVEDDWTQRCRAASDLWRPVAGLTNEALADQIRDDQVDILIDLMGHTRDNRLLVFARKPAPIQVSAWGHGGGTGLSTMDYLFSDPVAIPCEDRPLYAETIFDLPCNITFEAPSFSPDIAELPALKRGGVTFGSLNHYGKVTPQVEALWANILASVPGSRLLLKDRIFDQPSGRRAVLDRFARHGIGQERLELYGFSSRREHLATHSLVDIMLDPFPQNGGITTMESLWMGAPVVAKLGQTMGSRLAAAILHALGMCDWVAEDEEAYLAIAASKASDLNGLARFRRGIRAQILASPVGNPDLYTKSVEEAYRTMWRRWVANPPSTMSKGMCS